MLSVNGQRLKGRPHLEARISQPARQSHVILGVLVPTIPCNFAAPADSLQAQLRRQSRQAVHEERRSALHVVEDGLEERGRELLPFLLRNNHQWRPPALGCAVILGGDFPHLESNRCEGASDARIMVPGNRQNQGLWHVGVSNICWPLTTID